MIKSHQIAAIASLALVLGCEAPTEQESPEVAGTMAMHQRAADDAAPLAGPIYGLLTNDRGAAVADANICILYTQDCTTSDADGAFKLDGIRADESEAFFVFSPKFVPLIVPVQINEGDYRSFELELVAGDTFERTETGKVRLETQLVNDDMDVLEMPARWTLHGAYRGNEVIAERASAVLDEVRPDSFVAKFESDVETYCAPITGWSGDVPGQVAFPVLHGALTHVEQLCLVAE